MDRTIQSGCRCRLGELENCPWCCCCKTVVCFLQFLWLTVVARDAKSESRLESKSKLGSARLAQSQAQGFGGWHERFTPHQTAILCLSQARQQLLPGSTVLRGYNIQVAALTLSMVGNRYLYARISCHLRGKAGRSPYRLFRWCTVVDGNRKIAQQL